MCMQHVRVLCVYARGSRSCVDGVQHPFTQRDPLSSAPISASVPLDPTAWDPLSSAPISASAPLDPTQRDPLSSAPLPSAPIPHSGIEDFNERMYANTPALGNVSTPAGMLRLAMLPHVAVPRACPVASAPERAAIAASAHAGRGRGSKLGGKARLWKHLLDSSTVLHCFPPGGDPTAGEKRSIFMGHPKHTAAELAFQQTQGLWMLRPGWRDLPRGGGLGGDPADPHGRQKAGRGSHSGIPQQQEGEFLGWLRELSVEPSAPLPSSPG